MTQLKQNTHQCTRCTKRGVVSSSLQLCRGCFEHKRALLILAYRQWHMPKSVQWALKVCNAKDRAAKQIISKQRRAA